MNRLLLLCPLIVVSLAGCGRNVGNGPGVGQDGADAYLARRANFKTSLVKKGPSRQPWSDDPVPDGVAAVTYESDGRKLKAWLFTPKQAEKEKRPALVYLHGGFAFGDDDFFDCRPFAEAGYVIMCPTFRGENGNPGDFEMMFGEVDDAAAAVRWLATQKQVDPKRIFVFGHSSGGAISALLALYDDLPAVHTGSAGGLYGVDLFDGMAQIAPFDLSKPEERQMRVLVGNIRWMKRPHFAFTGQQDDLMKTDAARQEAAAAHAPLTIKELAGDHHSSLSAAMRGYLEVISANKQP